jgi:hypothetical protein
MEINENEHEGKAGNPGREDLEWDKKDMLKYSPKWRNLCYNLIYTVSNRMIKVYFRI